MTARSAQRTQASARPTNAIAKANAKASPYPNPEGPTNIGPSMTSSRPDMAAPTPSRPSVTLYVHAHKPQGRRTGCPEDTTALQDGNRAQRSGRADQAIRHYALALADAEPSATPIGRTPSAAAGPIGQLPERLSAWIADFEHSIPQFRKPTQSCVP